MLIKKSPPLSGTVNVYGAKNAVLVIMASLILTDGISILSNVPHNADVKLMIKLLENLGAHVLFDVIKKELSVDTRAINKYEVQPEVMNKMRASILVMGPLLARFGKAKVAFPGGDLIGRRPINYHLYGFKRMGVFVERNDPFVNASLRPSHEQSSYARIVLEYPSVGATENIMMFACLGRRKTVIVNAALEPEIFDLIEVLKKMGALIEILPGALIVIHGVQHLNPITHTIIPDRLEAGSIFLAGAITGGTVTIPNALPEHLDIFLEKLRDMGHEVICNFDKISNTFKPGITVKATKHPQAIHLKTGPFPGFPTDLQPCIMAALCLAEGVSTIEETVYENRMIHVKELSKMGAQVELEHNKATIRGVEAFYGCETIASDIRASCALVLAGLAAFGQTKMTGLSHWQRGYDNLEQRLQLLGGFVYLIDDIPNEMESLPTVPILPL